MDCYKIRLLSQPRAVVSAVRHLWTTIHLFGSIMNIPAAVCRRLFTERMSHRTNKHLIKVKGMKSAWKAGAERCSEESLYQLKLFLPHKGPVDGWKWKRHSEITWGGGWGGVDFHHAHRARAVKRRKEQASLLFAALTAVWVIKHSGFCWVRVQSRRKAAGQCLLWW